MFHVKNMVLIKEKAVEAKKNIIILNCIQDCAVVSCPI